MNHQKFLRSIAHKPKVRPTDKQKLVRSLWMNRTNQSLADRIINDMYRLDKHNLVFQESAQAYDLYLRDITMGQSEMFAYQHARQLVRDLREYHKQRRL